MGSIKVEGVKQTKKIMNKIRTCIGIATAPGIHERFVSVVYINKILPLLELVCWGGLLRACNSGWWEQIDPLELGMT